MLDDLTTVIETLKERINTHSNVLSGSETRTRMSLIDPLLQVLGWDVSDPGIVIPEFNVGGKRADYALLGANGKPTVVLEAKSLGTSLSSNEQMQMLNYANVDGVPFAGLTDGNQWKLYDVFDRKPLSERCILDFSISQDATPQIALQLLLLWRANMESGSPQPAQEPILDVTPMPSPEPKPLIIDPGRWLDEADGLCGGVRLQGSSNNQILK